MREDYIEARDLVPGDVILLRGDWRRVTKIWLHPSSPYNKIHTVRENESDKAIALFEKIPLSFVLGRKPVQVTKQVHFCSAIEEMAKLEALIKAYDEANSLPEKVQLTNTNFEIDSVIVQRQCHENMMASFNRLKNAVNAVQKP
ncbi:hypothetical protein Erwinia_phage_Aioli_00077 [Erwinia phage Aioli]|nr:hypothetical protein Erwinia_phage_Aioli_00077 [Erwinia phage Aioli]